MISRVLSVAFLLLLPFSSLAQTTDYGPQLTEAALKIQGAISPACNTTDDCVTFVNEVIPRCQKLRGDAGCWCGNHNPLHFCAICMSNPTDNRTSPDQTAAAIEGHQNYHTLCNAFEAALNASSTASAGPSSTSASTASQTSESSSQKAPIGAIVGGAVGGGLAVIIALVVFIIWMRQRNKKQVGPSNVSLFSAAGASTMVDGQARPYSGYSAPQSSFGHHDSSFNGGYAPVSAPYQTSGMRSPGMMSDGSYNKHPEPMTAGL